MARRNKKHEEHENHERWLITYADLITLLLIFFVIMYSMSKIDMAKYTELSKSLAFQFKKSDTVVPSGRVGIADPGDGLEGDQTQKDPEKEALTAEETEESEEETIAKAERKAELIKLREQELKDLMEKTEKYINDNKLQTKVSVKDTARGIAITLNDLFLFDSGRADLKPASIPILEKLGSLFPTLGTPISIEGHTDNEPLNPGSIYKDNDELAAERSLSVKRVFGKNAALHDTLIGTYYGDTRPIAPNDTPANRQKNRRVEIIVLRAIEADLEAEAASAP